MSYKINFWPNRTGKTQRLQFLYHNSSDSSSCIVTWGEKENSYSISQGFRHRRIYYASFSCVTNGLEAHNSTMTLTQLSRSQIRWLTYPWHDGKMESLRSAEAGANTVRARSQGKKRFLKSWAKDCREISLYLKTGGHGLGWCFSVSHQEVVRVKPGCVQRWARPWAPLTCMSPGNGRELTLGSAGQCWVSPCTHSTQWDHTQLKVTHKLNNIYTWQDFLPCWYIVIL